MKTPIGNLLEFLNHELDHQPLGSNERFLLSNIITETERFAELEETCIKVAFICGQSNRKQKPLGQKQFTSEEYFDKMYR